MCFRSLYLFLSLSFCLTHSFSFVVLLCLLSVYVCMWVSLVSNVIHRGILKVNHSVHTRVLCVWSTTTRPWSTTGPKNHMYHVWVHIIGKYFRSAINGIAKLTVFFPSSLLFIAFYPAFKFTRFNQLALPIIFFFLQFFQHLVLVCTCMYRKETCTRFYYHMTFEWERKSNRARSRILNLLRKISKAVIFKFTLPMILMVAKRTRLPIDVTTKFLITKYFSR